MSNDETINSFHPAIRSWFSSAFTAPSPPQELGWPSISAGNHTLILAPTGSGKTLAAFLWCINHLFEQHLNETLTPGVRILYISPLKALNNDIHRNLEEPLSGIHQEAVRTGFEVPRITSAVRTGDTPQAQRRAMLKKPPDILITTPESFYLMLTSKQARGIFRTVQYVIVDEIHSVCNNKRGVHLSLSLERLAHLAEQEFIRIGLSATQRPLETIARFLGGQTWQKRRLHERPVAIIDAGTKKRMDLRVESPVPDFSQLPQQDVWPHVLDYILENIRNHTTSLIFVNNRRLAERIAAKLNELIFTDDRGPSVGGKKFGLYAVPIRTGQDSDSTLSPNEQGIVQAYHGSMSRHAREKMEEDLKAGRLRALVATSSLELGIDIGSIDLVIQLQSPKGVARGLQRIGRSGHLVSATSKGRIIPTHREDLVEAAVVGRMMALHDVEQTSIPTNCLDVLAQQIVAAVSVEDWDVDELFDLTRQSFCYSELSRSLFMKVVEMLAGRYTHETFRELKPRISWDKVNGVLRALPGSSHIAITSGGTIADRGYLGVYLPDGKTKVGEVDEEFMYESRTGDTFILGTNVWRMIEITPQKVVVEGAPGQPARMPFWRGEGIGRTFELGSSVGKFRREVGERLDDEDCLRWLQNEYPLNPDASWNIVEYFRKQREFTRDIPSDRLLILEGFRDELGDPRIVLHSSFGRRVNGLLGFVMARRLHALTGVEPQMLYNDDGVLLRSSDLDEIPITLLDGLDSKTAQQTVLDEMLTSPLFGAQFRMNASRALLLPKAHPGKRTPLWLQRLRAGDLLQIVRQFDDFPIVVETVREVLRDVLDFDHFKEIIAGIENGSIRLVATATEVPSPFAASLLFDFISVYMYEWDQPKADRASQYLSLNRELLAELVDIDSIRSMLRPESLEEVNAQLQRTKDGYRARSPEELHEVLLRIGDLSEEEIRKRTVTSNLELLQPLVADGRATPIRLAGIQRWIAGEEIELYNSLPDESGLQTILGRYVHTHAVVTVDELSSRFEISASKATSLLDSLKVNFNIQQGHLLPETLAPSSAIQWCYRPNLEQIHRHAISLLRKEIIPASLKDYTRFLHEWQHLLPSSRWHSTERVGACLTQLEGSVLPVEIWERDIVPIRVRAPIDISQMNLSVQNGIVWVGAGVGRMFPCRRGRGEMFSSKGEANSPERHSAPAREVIRFLEKSGASFLSDIRTGTDLSLNGLNNALAELFWYGVVTNDSFEELTSIKRLARPSEQSMAHRVQVLTPKHNPRKAYAMRTVRKALRQVPGWSGRWSETLTPAVLGTQLTEEEMREEFALLLLERYGIVARETCRREDLIPWAKVFPVFQKMELQGKLRRGYFVEGLSGMQFAQPKAVERLRQITATGRKSSEAFLLINCCDPANPYGPGIPLPADRGLPEELRVNRTPGNHVLFRDGELHAVLENYATRIWTTSIFDETSCNELIRRLQSWLLLSDRTRPVKSIVIESWNGNRTSQSQFSDLLKRSGFRREKNQTMCYDGFP